VTAAGERAARERAEPRLSVNVDHVATLRQARRVAYPDPVAAARLAEAAGAAGITVHLRGDRRHIQERDVAALRAAVRGKLNLEMAATDEMVALALALRPDQVSLVPERPDEVTTEGGLDVAAHGARVAAVAARLAPAGIAVSLFLDPDERQLAALATLPRDVRDLLTGFEINTDAYTRAWPGPVDAEIAKLRRAAARGAGLGLAVYAGHGLSAWNVGPVAALPEVEELNIGHALVSRAVLVGLDTAVRELLAAMREARAR
jgi:pyridoxine 5-phosphate synthase